MLKFSRANAPDRAAAASGMQQIALARGTAAAAQRSRLPTFVATAATVAVLYFARDVFLPLAIAILLTFALAPLVSKLRRVGCPRSVAVVGTVTIAFLFLFAFSGVVAMQVSEVAQNLPTYQYNIVEKVRSLKETGSESQILDRLGRVMERINIEISRPEPELRASPEAEPERKPVLVEIFSPQRPVETLKNIINPLLGPWQRLAWSSSWSSSCSSRGRTCGPFHSLVGYGDLHRTTEALQDAVPGLAAICSCNWS